MGKYRLLKALKILVMIALAVVVFGFVTMYLWNWLMPTIFGLKTLSFGQALGLVILGKILFGGFGGRRGRGGRGRRGCRNRMKERFAQMTPEEREKFRSGMRERFGCRPGRRGAWPAEPTLQPKEGE